MLFLVKILYTITFMTESVQIAECISKNVNDVESTIRHDEITIHRNGNFDNITDASITIINEENEINSISKVTILNDLTKECKSFLERAKKFNSNIEKRKHESEVT